MPSLQSERAFLLPRESSRPWWTWGLGLAVHLPLVAALVWSTKQWLTEERSTPFLPPIERNHATVEVAMVYRAIALVAPVAPRGAAQPPRTATPAASSANGTISPLVGPSTRAPLRAGTGLPTPTAILPVEPVDAAPMRAQFTPAYGSGKLWVRPLPMSAREMAATVTGKTQEQLADSVVAVIMQRYLDELALEQADPANRPPSWVANLGGQKIGVDQKWVYLGPIRLPTILLGLLPINAQGNPTQAEMNKRFAAMREDLFYAARRAATLEEFKRNVAILREHKQYGYDLRKAQRTLPDSGHE